MRSGVSCLLIGVGFAVFAGCGAEAAAESEEIAAAVAKVVYGEDARQDVFEAPPSVFRRRAVESSVALVSYGFIHSTAEGIVVRGTPLGEVESLCSDQRFTNQPVAASCSGTLVAPDLVLTAGHCVSSLSACSNLAIVFNYRMADEERVLPIGDDDVYSCVEIVARSLPDSNSLDYAFLRLDRPVAPHLRPAPIRPDTGLLNRGAPVTMIGHPSGLPAKISGSAVVRDESIRSGNLFLTNLDAFAGNSGSGVYDEHGELAGVLVWGDRDYRQRDGETCREVNVVPASEGMEGVVYAPRALDGLCGESPHVSSVCDAFCGQDLCRFPGSEGSLCGEATCSPPPEWRCEPESYGSGGACDCDCGAVDPDCALPSRPVYGCQDSMVCGDEGTCVEDTGKTGRSAFMRGCDAPGGTGGLAVGLALALLFAARRPRRRELVPEM